MDQRQSIRDVMTRGVESVTPSTSLYDAARVMTQAEIGGVLVCNADGSVYGILTDRDIVVRALAQGKDPRTTLVESVCSKDPVCLSPSDSIDQAVRTMAEASVRRLPVVEDGSPVGVVSLGDLAMARQPESALGAISAAPPQS